MEKALVEKVKGLMQCLYGMADNFDAQGIGKQIPFVDEEEGLRGAINKDILVFLLKITDADKPISSACRDYINDCFEFRFGELTIEMARKEIAESNLPNICVLLPYFILMDKRLGGNNISSVYMKTVSFLALGYLNAQGTSSLEEIVRYHRYCTGCVHMIEKTLGEKVEYDPLEALGGEHKDLIRSAIEVDHRLHRTEEDPVVRGLEEALCQITSSGDHIFDSGEAVENQQEELTVAAEDTAAPTEEDSENPGGNGDIIPEDELGSAMDELDALIGLHEVKQQVKTMVNVLRIRQKCRELNVKRPAINLHMVFIGNPGTGKTTVARILGNVYKEAGLLSKGHLVEAGRADLVGKYVGHTAVQVKEVFEKAKGGILFIDEAYSLTNEDGGGFGQEAVETLLKLMEDNREDIAVIVAGYPALMQEFLDCNPGFRSRFPFVIQFPDYTSSELTSIFKCFCRENDIILSYDIMKEVRGYFRKEALKRSRNYGNARAVRNYFERMIMNQANRLVGEEFLDREDLCRFTLEDLPKERVLSQSLAQRSELTVV